MVDIKMPPEGYHWEEVPCPHKGREEFCLCSELTRKELVKDGDNEPKPVY